MDAPTIICPITTNVITSINLLRVHLKQGQIDKLSDVLVDQLRAIDNKRLIKKLGVLNKTQQIKHHEYQSLHVKSVNIISRYDESDKQCVNGQSCGTAH